MEIDVHLFSMPLKIIVQIKYKTAISPWKHWCVQKQLAYEENKVFHLLCPQSINDTTKLFEMRVSKQCEPW